MNPLDWALEAPAQRNSKYFDNPQEFFFFTFLFI